jgi:heme exporter protein D
MIPDLGKYAFAVVASYGASLGLLVALVALTLSNGARVRKALAAVEARTKGQPNG